MAINTGVTSTAVRLGKLENPEELALNLMNSSPELSLAIKATREALEVIGARGVGLKLYKAELLPYKIPARLTGRAMKVMFVKNEIARKIMTLHNDRQDISHYCQNVFQIGQELGIEMPVLEANMKGISIQKVLRVPGRLKYRSHFFRRPETFPVSHIIDTPTKAMILATGRGERMRPLTGRTPEPLLEVADTSPIGWYSYRLQQAGFTEIAINHAWSDQQAENALRGGANYGVCIAHSPERVGGLGTAGGIATTLSLLGNDPFSVIDGDVLTDIDFQAARLAAQHIQEHSLLTHLRLVDNPPHHPEGDSGLLSDGLVPASFADGQALTFNGVGVYHPVFLKDTPVHQATKLASLLRQAMSQNQISGEYHNGLWLDVGTVKRLQEADRIAQSW